MPFNDDADTFESDMQRSGWRTRRPSADEVVVVEDRNVDDILVAAREQGARFVRVDENVVVADFGDGGFLKRLLNR